MKMWMPGALGALERLRRALRCRASLRARQAQHDRRADRVGDARAPASKSPIGGDGEAGLDHVDAQLLELARDDAASRRRSCVAPGDCSPSRSVVSKICTKSFARSVIVVPLHHSARSWGSDPFRRCGAKKGPRASRPWPSTCCRQRTNGQFPYPWRRPSSRQRIAGAPSPSDSRSASARAARSCGPSNVMVRRR